MEKRIDIPAESVFQYTFSGISENAASLEISAEIESKDIDICTATVRTDSAGNITDETGIYWKIEENETLENSVLNFIDSESGNIESEIRKERERQHRNGDLIPEDAKPLP